MKYLYIIAIVSIIILSAIFRLGFMDSAVFGFDDDSTTCKISSYINDNRLPPLFTTSHGIPTISIAGLWFYLIMSFIRDPRLIILAAVGIPNTIAVFLCFLFCHKFIDKRTAVVATALFGFSNWAIIYSKNLWGVDILQFFSILIFYILMLGIYKSRPSITIFSVLLLPLFPNLHLTSFSIFVSVFLILTIYCFRKKSKYLFIVLVVSILAILTLYIILGKRFSLDRNIMADFITLNAALTTIELVVRGGWYYLYLYICPRYPNIDSFSIVFLKTMFIFGCIYIIKRIVQDLRLKRFSAYFIVGTWYFVFIILYGFIDLTTHGHYFMVILPSLFIITSIGFFSVVDFISGKNKIENWEFLLLFLIFAIWSPWICIILASALFFLKKLMRKLTVGILYSAITFILFFQAFSNIQLFIDIGKKGEVPGRAGMDLGAKINAARFVVKDAQLRFQETGLKSYYSITNDMFYSYIFRYLTPKNEDFISSDRLGNGYHYTIVDSIDKFRNEDMLKNSLYYKKIGPKLVIVERINEK